MRCRSGCLVPFDDDTDSGPRPSDHANWQRNTRRLGVPRDSARSGCREPNPVHGFGPAGFHPFCNPIPAVKLQPYLVAEAQPKNAKSGLWAYPDMPDPNAIILENYTSLKPERENPLG